jgi:hypothetical protein
VKHHWWCCCCFGSTAAAGAVHACMHVGAALSTARCIARKRTQRYCWHVQACAVFLLQLLLLIPNDAAAAADLWADSLPVVQTGLIAQAGARSDGWCEATSIWCHGCCCIRVKWPVSDSQAGDFAAAGPIRCHFACCLPCIGQAQVSPSSCMHTNSSTEAAGMLHRVLVAS